MLKEIYKVLDHPSDLKLKIFGADPENLFCNSVRAIASEQMGIRPYLASQEVGQAGENIEIGSPDIFSLLVDFANEIIYRSDANNKVYTECKIENISENILKAKILGIKADKKLDIKAATYHEGYVKKVNDHWEAEILFDI